MNYDMVMPKMGESITEGTIIKWLKKPGDTVEKDEIILEISTDKVDSEIPTPVPGKIAKLLAKEGETMEVGSVIAQIETDSATEPEKVKTEEDEIQPQPTESDEQTVVSPPPAKKSTAVEKPKGNRFYSPVVLNIARTESVSTDELEQVPGTGINGRVSKKDILKYLEDRKTVKPVTAPTSVKTAPTDGVEVIPLDHIRKKIAEHMVQTVHTSPHVGLFIEVDMGNVDQIRSHNKNDFLKNEGFKLTYMPFISEAVIKSLKEFPWVNSSLDGDNILVKHFVNLGIAVAADQGLIVPVIKNADGLNLVGIARAIYDLATRARNKKLKPDEVSGGTFSISNFGVYGTKIGFPLINQPQVAILGVGALKKEPVVVNDAIAIRPIMNISLTFDHRLIDGALGAQFLQKVGLNLQSYDPGLKL